MSRRMPVPADPAQVQREKRRVEHARNRIDGDREHGAEHEGGRELRARDRPRRDRQRTEDRRIARFERQGVPHQERGQRADRHRRRDEEESVGQCAQRRGPGQLDEGGEIGRRDEEGDEHRQGHDHGVDDRKRLVPVRMRRDEVVIQQPSNEQARDEANGRRVFATHDTQPRRAATSAMSRAVPSGSVVVTSCAMTSSSDELFSHHGAQLLAPGPGRRSCRDGARRRLAHRRSTRSSR